MVQKWYRGRGGGAEVKRQVQVIVQGCRGAGVQRWRGLSEVFVQEAIVHQMQRYRYQQVRQRWCRVQRW
jgi:hypothetical protein